MDHELTYKEIQLAPTSATFEAWKQDNWSMEQEFDHGKASDVPKFRTLKYRSEKIGGPPASGQGYPLYIALHGGGDSGDAVNNGQWASMMGTYKARITCGVWAAIRGIGDSLGSAFPCFRLHSCREADRKYDPV